jgi:hypothetical protein
MLDETKWLQLTELEKHDELQKYLRELILIEKGEHSLSHTKQQGKLSTIKADLQNKVFKILELENSP